jgi:hypothetical protein
MMLLPLKLKRKLLQQRPPQTMRQKHPTTKKKRQRRKKNSPHKISVSPIWTSPKSRAMVN